MSQNRSSAVMLHHGDCLAVMRQMPNASVDAVVTDPPYGLNFMGKDWDRGVPGPAFWVEALRLAKPGAHLLAFGGTRTHHRLVCAIEDAGWEIRDEIDWIFGSGFPKSHDVSRAIDRALGAERELTRPGTVRRDGYGDDWDTNHSSKRLRYDRPATAAAWKGWGTGLKPAKEPICVARKPLDGTVAANVLAHGTGALNIDACRVPADDNLTFDRMPGQRARDQYRTGTTGARRPTASGRWPANVIHDGSPEVLACFPNAHGQQATVRPDSGNGQKTDGIYGSYRANSDHVPRGDAGSAARFFYCAKASNVDRNDGISGPDLPSAASEFRPNHAEGAARGEDGNPYGRWAPRKNNHPTVKPTDLMRYLCRLVTPPGGVVLDPFMGSGSTGRGAVLEGFGFIGIERDASFVAISRQRIAAAQTAAEAERAAAAEARRQGCLFALPDGPGDYDDDPAPAVARMALWAGG